MLNKEMAPVCCQVTHPPVGCFVLLEVNDIVDEIKSFFYSFPHKKSDQLPLHIHFSLSYIN